MENEDGSTAIYEMSFYEDDGGRMSCNGKYLSFGRDCTQRYRAALIRCIGYEHEKKITP